MGRSRSPLEARATIIERLIDYDPKTPSEACPLRTLNKGKLKYSILKNLEWILNSRSSIPAHLYDERELTVIEYGMPDFGSYSPENAEDRALLEKRIERCISVFEPRLQEVRVRVDPKMEDEKSLRIYIEAKLFIETVREPISFKTIFQDNIGTWEIYEN